MRVPTIKTALCVLSVLAWQDAARANDDVAKKPVSFASGLPLRFERNRGQSPAEVAFAARGPGYGFFLTANGAVLILSSPSPASPVVIRMTFNGANRAPIVSGIENLPGRINYLRGRDAARWVTDIPTYAKVAYRDLYRDVDAVFYGNGDGRHIEYDFIVAPAGDPTSIAITFDGVDDLAITADGDLVMHAGGREIRHRRPLAHQDDERARQRRREVVEGRYVMRGPREIGFELDAYDTSRTLVIDPVIAFSSYLGGTGFDIGQRIAVDATGSVYLTGTTASPDFPTTTGPPRASALDEAFVAKVSPDGSTLVYATYLGGTGNDRARDIAVDAAGHAYVTGFTDSADFPLHNAVRPTFGGPAGDAFVAELSTAGDALVYATYLGGARRDTGEGIAVDRGGSTYVTGSTISTDFPTTPNAFQTRLNGIDPSLDAFVTKLAPNGTAIVYSTFLGGGEPDAGTAIAVNARGNAFVAGVTGSGDFPRVRPFQANAFLGISDAFVSKLSADGSSLVYSSNLGGDETDVALDITVDATDRAIVCGYTTSDDFPLARPIQPALAGSADGFVTMINPAGASIAFSTYLGGAARDEITSIAVDGATGGGSGGVVVAGRTFSTDFPTRRPIQPAAGGGLDAFVARLDLQHRQLVYATYFGGTADDDGTGVALDAAGSAYVVGTTMSDDLTMVGALQGERAGETDAFFAKITDFTVCLQDDQSGVALQIDPATGGYQLASACGAGGLVRRVGMGRVVGGDSSLLVLLDQGVLAIVNGRTHTGFASVLVGPRQVVTITARDTANNR